MKRETTLEQSGSAEAKAVTGSSHIRLIVRNVGWNWTGTATAMVCGFVVAPFLVDHLGDSGYGLWIVMGSLAGYFTLLDFGVRGAIGRHIALYRARGDTLGVRRTFNSALVIMVCVGAVSVGVTTTIGLFWLHAFHVPPEQAATARPAFLLVSANLALNFPLQVFEGTLWGHQRFDALNWVDIPTVLLRSAFSLYFVGAGFGLVALAAITFLMGIANGTAKIWFTFRENRDLCVNFREADRKSIAMLFGYGRWNLIISIARMSKAQLSPIAIGALLNVALVTPYAVARRLQDYAYTTLWTATGVLTPVSTGFHANDDRIRQRQLLVEGGRWCLGVAIYFLTLFLFLGKTLIGLWMGKRLAYASTLLIVLASGEVFAMSQSVTSNILVAMAKHRPLAIVALIEFTATLILIGVLAAPFGLFGVCIAFAVCQTVFSGLGTMYFGCRATGVRISAYLSESVVPVVGTVLVPAALLGVTVRLFSPETWGALLIIGTAYTACYWSVWLWRFELKTKMRREALRLPFAVNWIDGRVRSVLEGLR